MPSSGKSEINLVSRWYIIFLLIIDIIINIDLFFIKIPFSPLTQCSNKMASLFIYYQIH